MRIPGRFLGTLVLVVALAPTLRAEVATPAIEGPITGGSFGKLFNPIANPEDIEAAGYLIEEFFMSGDAVHYAPAPATTLEPDGLWQVVPNGAELYKTRLIVVRPDDPNDFRGTVVVNWLNVTSGFEIASSTEPQLFKEGAAWVGVSAQRDGLEGFGPVVIPGLGAGLRVWDPVRYGTLAIGDDKLSYDIFTQAGFIVGPDRPNVGTPQDPMHGLAVERLIASGASQSAHRMSVYYNAIQPLDKVFDGFLIDLNFGVGADLAPTIPTPAAKLRTDLEAPALIRNSETEARAIFPVRQPDSDTFRFWEVAGTPHAGRFGFERVDLITEREFGFPLIRLPCDAPANTLFINEILNSGFHHMNRWIQGGPPPPSLPRITFTGEPPDIATDAHGNALGGIRVPGFEVPAAIHLGSNTPANLFCRLAGSSIPFSRAKIDELYPRRRDYVMPYVRAANAGRKAGFLLRDDATALKKAVRSLKPFPEALFWPARPLVTGPIAPGGDKPTGFNDNAGLDDLLGNDYVEEEYFFEGKVIGKLSEAGATGFHRYKTRMLVRRPARKQRFKGTVVVEWMNVSGGFDAEAIWPGAQEYLMRKGVAFVSIDAQPIGVTHLAGWDPARYGSLSHPAEGAGVEVCTPAGLCINVIVGDTVSDQIFGQAAAAIRDPAGINPLGELEPKRVIAFGASQSGRRLTDYVNQFHAGHQLFDAYLIHVGGGEVTESSARVLKLNSEREAEGYFPNRQPDSESFRYWEVAGVGHSTPHVYRTLFTNVVPRAFGFPVPHPCELPLGIVPHEHVLHAALDHLQRWIKRGTPPPSAPLLEITPGNPPTMLRDEHGNALGGIRLPHVDVPTGRHVAVGNPPIEICNSFPGFEAFDETKLDALYPSHKGYVTKVREAIRRARKDGFLLIPDARTTLQEAAASDIGN